MVGYWDDATGLVVVFNSGCGFAGGVVVDLLYAIITIYLCFVESPKSSLEVARHNEYYNEYISIRITIKFLAKSGI